MIDCHAHISHSLFDQDREKVINQAQLSGVKTIIAVGEDIDDSRLVLKMCRKYTGVLLPCMGIHPDAYAEYRKAPSNADITDFITLIRENKNDLFGMD